MSTDEGHIHWDGCADGEITYLEQPLRLTAEVSNAQIVREDPVGTVRIRAAGWDGPGLPLPTDGWQPIPGTDPVLEALAGTAYPIGYIRIRQA